ncbi:hypothetical protein SAMD00019534_102200 [Acytostelium subglobosum LB1]|uniref:hypothetical protein n=1 Tax=Acytostelium subglobosum LB1 TaxID=1410327 RepID=UPI000644CE39|nr:hypothetical protein SAMD00019534_102200 [Acytostelium subglobosum LB1]GAM27045.1 hypothetical protein SAMD00019534_102200 [Acytostelium subglobosum LB1]|eukprot:XP_012749925.1 hypothetical protein SAMD00019534_102200 [Acytostelium subglobosum LB1]
MSTDTGSSSRSLVKLNIGGTKYLTTRDTLLSAQSTFFTALLSGSCGNAMDSDGHYFIDRDGDIFAHILSYMRTGYFNASDHIQQRRALIYREADFYGIRSLISLLEPATCSAGGHHFVASITTRENRSPITNAITKANFLIITYADGAIECWVYKGLSYHWALFFTLHSKLPHLNGLVLSITKNKYNEVANLILCGFTKDKQVALWKIKVEYIQFQAMIIREHVFSVEHYIHFIHFLVNGYFLAIVSKLGKLTIVDIANDQQTPTPGVAPLLQALQPQTTQTTQSQQQQQLPPLQMKTLTIDHQVTAIADIEYSLYLGCSNGTVIELKQNIRDNWDWKLEEVYKLNNVEYLHNPMFASPANSEGMIIGQKLRNLDLGLDDHSSGGPPIPHTRTASMPDDGELVSAESLLRTFDHSSPDKIITCISIANIQLGAVGNGRAAMVIGTLEGTAHLCFRATRGRTDPYMPGAKMVITDAGAKLHGTTHQLDPITSVVVSGGNEGVFITAHTQQRLTKSWQYKYTNPTYPHMIKCLSVHSLVASNGFAAPAYADIAKFKCFHHLHYATPKSQGIHVPLLNHTNSFQSSTVSQDGSSSGSPTNGGHHHFINGTIKKNSLASQHRSSSGSHNTGGGTTGGSGGSSPQITPNFTPEEPDNPRLSVSPYNQVYLSTGEPGGSRELVVYAQSHRRLGEALPTNVELGTAMTMPLARIPLIDSTPIIKVLTVTFGGVDPVLSDLAYLMLTIHESNGVYCWDLRDIDDSFAK